VWHDGTLSGDLEAHPPDLLADEELQPSRLRILIGGSKHALGWRLISLSMEAVYISSVVDKARIVGEIFSAPMQKHLNM